MWFLVLRRGVVPRSEWTVTLDTHLAWMEEQHRLGNIVISGPTPDRSCGIYVVVAPSREDAEAIVDSDPFRRYSEPEIIEWEVHQMLGIGGFSEQEQALWLARQREHSAKSRG